MKDQRGSRGITLLCPKVGARRGWVVNTTPRLTLASVRALVLIGTDWWAPGPVWTEKIPAPPQRESQPGLPSP